ncbi:MAG: DEAD/DEAH box helicase, partial [Crocinitomicaceae bacterium]
DIAMALPAIFRAKRAVIVGDPNQLRHYSFVSRAQQFELQKKFELPKDKIFDYRNRSILDLYISKVTKQEQVSFLREHYRSTPSLIEFSNQKFYDGQLEIIKSTPKHTSHNQIELINVNGFRDKKGVNEIEALAVIGKLKSIIEQYKNSHRPPSIGIISPFNSQISYINKLLKDHFELDTLKKYNLLCGTPYTFQGSEREIVLLSFCVCDKSHPSAFIHANKPEVLNVAVTRAKSFQYVFKSMPDEFCNKESLLFDYFRFIKTFSHVGEQEPEKDEFQKEVVLELEKKNFDEIKCGYPVAGSLLDILIVHNNQNYFIDLIGYPGIYREAFSIERYKALGRTGIKCLPLHYSYWKKNKKASIERIESLIND